MKILSARPVVWGSLAVAVAAAACSDSENNTSPCPTDAGQSPRTDAAPVVDAAPPGDAGPDATEGDADAGTVPVTTRFGAAGSIWVNPNFAMALFKEDERIIESPAFPDCLIQAGSLNNKPLAFGGTLTIGGDAVGQDGGIAAPVQITPTGPFDYTGLADPGLFFERASGQKVQIGLDGTTYVPLLPPTTLRSPMFADIVRVTSPTLPDGGDTLPVKSTEPFDVKWNVPSGSLGEEKLVVAFLALQSDAVVAELRCGFPIGAGQASIPVELMKAFRSSLGQATGGVVPGVIRIRSGGFKVFAQERAAYTMEVTHFSDTSFAEGAETQINFE